MAEFQISNAKDDASNVKAWGIAAAAVLVVLGAVLIVSHHRKAAVKAPVANMLLPLDGYAADVPISGIQMSDTDTFGGGRLIYIEGHITNKGSKTVTGVTVQTIFRTDPTDPTAKAGMQVETGELMLIRTREPYVDTEPVSREPIKPGEDREFRLTFEHVDPAWNQQYPEVHVVNVQ